MAADTAEICLLWGEFQIRYWWSCMNKAEWASWAQAVGVLVTISIPFASKFVQRLRAYKILRGMDIYIGGSIEKLKIARSYIADDVHNPKMRLTRVIQIYDDIRHPYKEELEAMGMIDPGLGMRMQDLIRDTQLFPKKIKEILQNDAKFVSQIVLNLNATYMALEIGSLIAEWEDFSRDLPIKRK